MVQGTLKSVLIVVLLAVDAAMVATVINSVYHSEEKKIAADRAAMDAEIAAGVGFPR